MGMPNIPDITPEIGLTRAQTVDLLLASIALEELGLAHIINGEGEKIQMAVSPEFDASLVDLMNIDENVGRTIRSVIKKEMLLQFKLEDVSDILRQTYRIVLTWGETPRDLDAHLKGPKTGGGQFHVFYADMTYAENGHVIAHLDQDVTTGFGPETIFLNNQYINGTYNYFVYNWSNETPLSQSNAVVKVYRGNKLINTFNVPAGDGRYWNVFNLVGDTITPINTITNVEP